MQAGPGFRRCYQLVLQRTPSLLELAASHLLWRGIDEAELAHRQVLLGVPHRGAKRSALHRAGGVELAGPCRRIEHRARLVVRKVFKGLFVLRLGKEEAAVCVARKLRREPGTRGRCALPDSIGNALLCTIQCVAELLRIELRDGKHSYATLVTARPASEPMVRALRRRGQRSIKNFEQFSHVTSSNFCQRTTYTTL